MNIRPLRLSKGMTQAELANKAQIKQNYISRLETGVRSNPTIETLRKIAEALNVSIDDLINQ